MKDNIIILKETFRVLVSSYNNLSMVDKFALTIYSLASIALIIYAAFSLQVGPNV